MLFPDLACGFIGVDMLLTSAPAMITCHTGGFSSVSSAQASPRPLTCGSQIHLPGVNGQKPAFLFLLFLPPEGHPHQVALWDAAGELWLVTGPCRAFVSQ